MKPVITTLLISIVFTTLAGCSTPYKKPIVIPVTAEFKGIDTLLREENGVSLITIHGMCHHDQGWLNGNIKRYAGIMGLPGTESELRLVYGADHEGVRVYAADLVRDDDILRVYGILYSAVTRPVKQEWLCGDVSKETAVCPGSDLSYSRKRARLNAALKNKLLNDCLADAVAYLGPAGDDIRSGVRGALTAIFTDLGNHPQLRNAPVVFLSESLGSKVLGDALLCGEASGLPKMLIELERTRIVFLGANQIPLLNIGFRDETCDVGPAYEKLKRADAPPDVIKTKNRGLAGFLDLVESARQMKRTRDGVPGVTTPLPVVAFTDPNDLLSYEVSRQDVGERKIINVIVSNDTTWLGFVENPLAAHEGYRENEAVIQFLKCGRSADGRFSCP
jgi:hypothetical protein